MYQNYKKCHGTLDMLYHVILEIMVSVSKPIVLMSDIVVL